MILTILWRGLVLLAGLLLAGVVVGVFVFAATTVGLGLPRPDAPPEAVWDFGTAVGFGVFMALAVLGYAAGPALLSAIITEGFQIRAPVAHLLIGGGVGVTTYLILHMRFFGAISFSAADLDGLLILVAAGFVGGFVYWLVAGRSAGRTAYRAADDPGIRRAVDRSIARSRGEE